MQQCIFVALWLLASKALAEPPAYGSSSDEFDINSISSYLDDDQTPTAPSSKGVSYSYSNSFLGQIPGQDRFKGGNSPFVFGQKSPVTNAAVNPAYSAQTGNFNPAFGSIAQASVPEYSQASNLNSYAGNYETYNSSPSVGIGNFGTASYSAYSSSPLVAHGTNNVPFIVAPSKAVSSVHGNVAPSYSTGTIFGDVNSATYPVSGMSSSSTHGAGTFEVQGSSSFGGHSSPSSGRPSFPFEKPSSPGFPHISNYKGSSGPYNSYEGEYSSKPPRYSSPYKGFSSGGPPLHFGGPSGPSSQIANSVSYKSPYYSEYKGGPGLSYSSRPPPTSLSSYKSPNNYESYNSTPFKYVSESPRYPRYPGKYSLSRPGHSGAKYSYSSRPLYTSGYKTYNSKPPSYSGHF